MGVVSGVNADCAVISTPCDCSTRVPQGTPAHRSHLGSELSRTLQMANDHFHRFDILFVNRIEQRVASVNVRMQQCIDHFNVLILDRNQQRRSTKRIDAIDVELSVHRRHLLVYTVSVCGTYLLQIMTHTTDIATFAGEYKSFLQQDRIVCVGGRAHVCLVRAQYTLFKWCIIHCQSCGQHADLADGIRQREWNAHSWRRVTCA